MQYCANTVRRLKTMVKYITKYLDCVNPLSLQEYMDKGGFAGLYNVLASQPKQVVDIVIKAGLTGRGGACFPTGRKWEAVSQQLDSQKYVICNADEGEPGTFKDKKLLQNCPFQILEGMVISAYAVGATRGIIYVRGEYSQEAELLKEASCILRKANLLGNCILQTKFSFDIEVYTGAGAYICGEETALLESIEGKRGIPRLKPPFPGEVGLWGHPTLINNVETLCNVPLIFELGAEKYLNYGSKAYPGTKLISLSGAVTNPGIYEVPFGAPLSEIIFSLGKISNKEVIKFVQLGGLSGACFSPNRIDEIYMEPNLLREIGLTLGSGAVYVASNEVDIKHYLNAAMHFFMHESCGRCAPCREGSRHIAAITKSMKEGKITAKEQADLDIISQVMKDTAACGLGQTATTSLRSLMELFSEEFVEVVEA